MSSLQRVICALEGGIPDTVPVFPRDLTLSLDAAGYSTPDVFKPGFDAEKSARSVLTLQRMMGHDAVVGSIHYMGMELPAFGGRVQYPEMGIPSVVRHPLADPSRIDEIQLPDFERDEPLSGIMESYGLVCEALGDTVAVVPNVEGPLTKAGLLRGIENLMMDMFQDPGLVDRLVNFSTEMIIEFIRMAAERGASPFAFLASATDNPDIFGAEAFRRYSLSPLSRIVRDTLNSGLRTVYHPHGVFEGDFAPLVDEAISTGIHGFQFAEKNDLGRAKRAWGSSICVLGGIDAFTALLLGPPSRIISEVKGSMDSCAPGGGYIYMCSGSLHRGLPLEHLRIMMRACRLHGRYEGRSTDDEMATECEWV